MADKFLPILSSIEEQYGDRQFDLRRKAGIIFLTEVPEI